MYTLQVVIGPGVAWNFLFKTKQSAEAAFAAASEDVVHLVDDFGTIGQTNKSEIRGFLLEEMDQAQAAALHRILNEQRTRSKAQQMIQTDPQLRLAQGGGGLPVTMPMGMGPNGRF